MWALLVLAAAPRFVVAPGLEPASEVERSARSSWDALEATVGAQPSSASVPITIERARLEANKAGQSVLGRVSLRQNVPGAFTAHERVALAHELAHQYLLQRCPAATRDVLFHEAFAIATSGELSAWREGDYESLTEAVKIVDAVPSLETPRARKALARLLVESLGPGDRLPKVIARRLGACDGASAWSTLTASSLTALDGVPRERAFVVMSRHSGEVLLSGGDVSTARPFGSTLKPFVLAAATAAPTLSPRVADPEWACGDGAPKPLAAPEALLLSCNGYFLDWAERTPGVERLGAFGPVLVALGLPRVPEHMSETIGLRSTLALSPLALAAAYRLLAEARPDLITLMRRNARDGTLAGLPESQALLAIATKTGTVRDGESRPVLGWLVGVLEDVVIVQATWGKAPRQTTPQFLELVEKARALAARDAVEVQAFTLWQPGQVDLRCDRGGVALGADGPVLVPPGFASIASVSEGQRLLCLGAPFEVRLPRQPESRWYAGVFRRDAPAPYVPAPGVTATDKERRARTGSEFVFRTTRLHYVTGVLASEDASIVGEPRAALVRVVSHNADTRERHGSRPVCDTTHCQVFQGTKKPSEGDAETLRRPKLSTKGWLLFSRGGDEPWTASRPRAQVERVLKTSLELVVRLQSAQGSVQLVRTVVDEGDPREEVEAFPCELLRGPLKLPSCPTSASWNGTTVELSGVGQGHGMGLNVEAARRSGADQETILRNAYGP